MDTVIMLFDYLLTGMQSVMGFIQTLPQIFSVCVQSFPPFLGVYLLACLGVILAIRVLELLP